MLSGGIVHDFMTGQTSSKDTMKEPLQISHSGKNVLTCHCTAMILSSHCSLDWCKLHTAPSSWRWACTTPTQWSWTPLSAPWSSARSCASNAARWCPSARISPFGRILVPPLFLHLHILEPDFHGWQGYRDLATWKTRFRHSGDNTLSRLPIACNSIALFEQPSHFGTIPLHYPIILWQLWTKDGGCLLTGEASYTKAAPMKYSEAMTGPKFCPGELGNRGNLECIAVELRAPKMVYGIRLSPLQGKETRLSCFRFYCFYCDCW